MVLLLVTFFVEALQKPTDKKEEHCRIVIVGTGFAGSYAAYQLSTNHNYYGKDICIIEKLSRDGGRIMDVSTHEGGPIFGAGALRLVGTQYTLINLAMELNVKYQKAAYDVELLKARGQYFIRDMTNKTSDSKMMCDIAYNLNGECVNDDTNQTDIIMMKDLLKDLHKGVIDSSKHDFPPMSISSYIINQYQDEGLAFVRDSIRYVSLFTGTSARGVMDFLQNELEGDGLDPERIYPEGGLSALVKEMLARSEKAGVRIFRSEPVSVINDHTDCEDCPHKQFSLETTSRIFYADAVLCSIDPLNMKKVKGSVAETIKKTPQFEAIQPTSVAVVTTWWPERFWERSKFTRQKQLSRVVTHQHCFNIMEIPTFPYAQNQNATRAVYDDGVCVDMWRQLTANVSYENLLAYKSDELEMLTVEVVNSLRAVFTDVEVPKPTFIHGIVHENSWHFQPPNSTVTNQEIFEWSKYPLGKQKNFVLIGEAYNLNFIAWCDGALKSTQLALQNHFDMKFPCYQDSVHLTYCDASKRYRRNVVEPFKHFNIHHRMP